VQTDGEVLFRVTDQAVPAGRPLSWKVTEYVGAVEVGVADVKWGTGETGSPATNVTFSVTELPSTMIDPTPGEGVYAALVWTAKPYVPFVRPGWSTVPTKIVVELPENVLGLVWLVAQYADSEAYDRGRARA
jgi:hypothetical protein